MLVDELCYSFSQRYENGHTSVHDKISQGDFLVERKKTQEIYYCCCYARQNKDITNTIFSSKLFSRFAHL